MQNSNEQRNLDFNDKTLFFEEEDLLAGVAVLVANLLLGNFLKPFIFDPFLGRIYNNSLLYLAQLYLFMPVGTALLMALIKINKTKGYIENSLFLFPTKTGPKYSPFIHSTIIEKQEILHD